MRQNDILPRRTTRRTVRVDVATEETGLDAMFVNDKLLYPKTMIRIRVEV